MTEKTHKHRDKIPFGKNMSRLVPSWEGVRQGCILSPCLFNLHVEYIMRNAGLDESQAGRNINNLRYVDGIILNTKKERGTKRASWQRCKSSKKAGLELNIQKQGSWHPVPSLHGNRWGKNGNSDRIYFLGLQNHWRQWLQPQN